MQYGDIDARFYSSLESAFTEVITVIRESGNQALIEEFHPRLESIVYETSGMGLSRLSFGRVLQRLP
jgi:hypothetical protein